MSVAARCCVVVAALAALCAIAHASDGNEAHGMLLNLAQTDPNSAFIQWKQLHGKAYAHDSQEHETRFQTWSDSLKTVVEHQSKGKKYELHLGPHADMSDDEFRQVYLMKPKEENEIEDINDITVANLPKEYLEDELPLSIDWRDHGIVGPIKNQHVNNASCGCCWAFATIAMVEMKNAQFTGKLVTLSEQQLIDCDLGGYDAGCDGGSAETGVQYIVKNGGIDTDADYPYIAMDGTCDKEKEAKHVVTVDGVEHLPNDNETLLAHVVAKEPIVAGVCCGTFLAEWKLYKGGIFNPGNCYKPVDHAVPIVGFGVEDGQDYWLIKNSWGDTWGEKGYLRVPRNVGGRGQFGLAHKASFVLKEHPNPSDAASTA